MPDLQVSGFHEDQNGNGAERSEAVADQHGYFFVPFIAKCPCKNAHENIGGIRTDGEQRCDNSRALLLVGPNHQREIGHGASQRRKRLCRPQQEKGAELFGSTQYWFHHDFAPFIVRFVER